MTLPAPVIETWGGFTIVRDDLLPGGTKRRAAHVLFTSDAAEYVYASPTQGHAQVALAYAARDAGKRLTIVCAKRNEFHPLTREAHILGAHIVEIPNGMLSVVSARAREYVLRTDDAELLPFGLDCEAFISALADVARALPVAPLEVWSVASSGVLTRALQRAWPCATFCGVQVGATPNAGRATVHRAPERFEQRARSGPPFPSSPNYDAKVWDIMLRHAPLGSLFWNVAGLSPFIPASAPR